MMQVVETSSVERFSALPQPQEILHADVPLEQVGKLRQEIKDTQTGMQLQRNCSTAAATPWGRTP